MRQYTHTIIPIIITLFMKLAQSRHTNSGQLFCNCPSFVIALVPDLFFGGKTVRKLLSLCCCENELQQLSNKWRNKNTTYSTKHGLILVKLGQLNTRRMLIWRSICHFNHIKYYVNFFENFQQLMKRYHTLFT